jgi:hypothetical protein
MASELTAADVTHRLADQLQVLSQVAETLTFRLLDLEERLAGQELQLQGGSAGSDLIAGGTELRLADTEERLTRLESLLESGLAMEADLAEPVRHLRSVEPDLGVFAPAAGDSEAEDFGPEDFGADDPEAEDSGVVESGVGESVVGEQGTFDPIEPDPMDSDPLHLAPIHAEQAQDATTDDFAFRDDPFMEEHEQPFMDELSA